MPKTSPARRKARALPLLTLDTDLQRLGALQALAIAESASADLLINSRVWTSAHTASLQLFADARVAHMEHIKTARVVCRTSAERSALERSEWAHYARLTQAAYLIGIAVGRRTDDGAR